MALLTPATVHALLDEHGLHPKRSLGQNFLADPNTARRIVALADVPGADPVLEIGPGLGSLTLALLAAGHAVVALELDDRLADALPEVVATEAPADVARVRVVHGDAMTDGPREPSSPKRARRGPACRTCPYNVAMPVVVRLLEETARSSASLVMVQREVGERLAAGARRPRSTARSR